MKKLKNNIKNLMDILLYLVHNYLAKNFKVAIIIIIQKGIPWDNIYK